MRITHLLITSLAVLLTACGGGTSNEKTTTESADSVACQTDNEAAMFYEQLTFDKFVSFLYNPDAETAAACGFEFIYEDSYEEEGYAGEDITVYGWGVEKGKKQDFGYELNYVSDRACVLKYCLDTSQNIYLCFKDKSDADRFFESAKAYGLVVLNGNYHVPQEKLEGGTVTLTDSFGDYAIMASINEPEYNEVMDCYTIMFTYFAS